MVSLLGFLLLVLTLTVFILRIRKKRSKRPPQQLEPEIPQPISMGELVYSDATGDGEILIDNQWGLTGKPDEVWRNGDKLHVVEVKSSSLPYYQLEPFYGHKMQLAVYMRLAQVHFKLPVESGEIRYGDGQRFQFDWDESMKRQLWSVIKRIRKVDATGKTFVKVKKSQCQKCRYYSVCDKKRFAR